MKKQLMLLAALCALPLLFAGCRSSGRTHTHSEGSSATTERGVSVVTGAVETVPEADIALHKEELVVGKREVSNGGVLIRTVVQTENVSQPVDLRREEYVIERIPASQAKEWEARQESHFRGGKFTFP